MKANKPHHQNNISMVVDLVNWAAGIMHRMVKLSTKFHRCYRNFLSSHHTMIMVSPSRFRKDVESEKTTSSIKHFHGGGFGQLGCRHYAWNGKNINEIHRYYRSLLSSHHTMIV